MDLYLLRHGDAVDRATGGYARDDERPLTDAGRAEVRQAAKALAALGVGRDLDLLLTSPLVRAAQTAAIVAKILGPRHGPLASDALAPGGRPEAVLRALHGHGAEIERAILVGHMPDLGKLAGWLVWGRDDAIVTLRTAGVCRVELPPRAAPGDGELRWLLPPRLLRRLA